MRTLEVLDKVLKGKRIVENTQRHYRELLTSLAEFSPEWPNNGAVINEWINTLTDRADTSVRMWFDYGHAAGRYMQRISGRNSQGGYNFYNPFDDAEKPEVKRIKRRNFSADEVMLVIGACRFGYDRELILTLIDSTCRISDLVNLKGRDVDEAEGFINCTGKTGQSHYRLDRRICRALKELAGGDDNYVFVGRDGKRLNEDSLTSRARRIIVRAGIKGKKLGPHSLRHAGGTLIARYTRSALAVKAMLQHQNIATSMKYIHDVEEEIQQDISPLKLVGMSISNGKHIEFEPRQIGMGEGDGDSTALVLTDEPEIIEGVPDFSDDMFPQIEEGKESRPLLKTDDLKLMRRIFVEFARRDGNHIDMLKARELMKRIIRRPKGSRVIEMLK